MRQLDAALVRYVQWIYDFLLDLTGVRIGSFRIAFFVVGCEGYALLQSAEVYQWFGLVLAVLTFITGSSIMIAVISWLQTSSMSLKHIRRLDRLQASKNYSAINLQSLHEQQYGRAARAIIVFVTLVVAPFLHPFAVYGVCMSILSYANCSMVRDRDGDRFAVKQSTMAFGAA